MSKCKKCGLEVESWHVLCPNCGEALEFSLSNTDYQDTLLQSTQNKLNNVLRENVFEEHIKGKEEFEKQDMLDNRNDGNTENHDNISVFTDAYRMNSLDISSDIKENKAISNELIDTKSKYHDNAKDDEIKVLKSRSYNEYPGYIKKSDIKKRIGFIKLVLAIIMILFSYFSIKDRKKHEYDNASKRWKTISESLERNRNFSTPKIDERVQKIMNEAIKRQENMKPRN